MNSKLKWLIGTWLLIQAIAVHAQTYTAIELPFAVGLSDGSDTMGGTPINNAGQVVGFSFTQSGTVGYLYSNGVTTALANDFIPNAINNSGEIAGTSSTPGVVTVAAVYNNGALTSIGTLGSEPGYPPSNVPVNESYGVSLNDGGQVVGRSTAPGGGEPPFLYSNGSMTAPNIGPGAQAAGINNGGTIVGSFIPSPAQNDLFHAYVYVNGSVTDLGTLGGAQSFGNAINNAGQVTGTAQTASGQLDAFLSSNGQMKDLGSLNGSGSIGYGINTLGQVVGTSNVDGNSLD
ncbi:MAG TPA: hypothetical protein VGV09_15650, partial [Steroidobacteraceae bacterium]|nr:hypothetical protein [Steroidobacteraceae bacterium]